MNASSHLQGHPRPENLVHRLVTQLSRHALWDSMLVFGPPVLALVCIAAYLAQAAWVSQLTLILIAGATAGIGVLAVMLRYRPMIPSISSAARLVDQRAGAMDRFLTLATIEAANSSASFIARLREETAGFGARVELNRDFPYKIKRSAYWSLSVSLLAALLFYFLLPLVQHVIHPLPGHQRLRELAERMAQKPTLTGLAKDLKALAAKLENPQLSQEEKQELIQDVEKKIDEQQKKEEQKDNRDLLGQAASAAKGMEKEQSASGQDEQKDQQKGGGIQDNLSKEGQGENKQSKGGSGESKGDSSGQPNKDTQQGNSGQGQPKEPGPEKNPQQGDAKGNQPDPNQPGKEQSKEKMAKNEGGSKDGAGKNQASEEPPEGTSPAERYYKAGEGNEGVRGARYVTVQLPEELAADSKGEGRASKESRNNRARPQVPVSNVPLPSHVPNAPSEKQQLPIEYRGIIR
jgi:hypothetical protein